MMKVITLRKIPPAVGREITHRAKKSGQSLARTVIQLLEERLGLERGPAKRGVHRDLDGLAGRWSEAQAAEFDRAIAEQRGIDAELWR
jgi:hypothetical protein